jgi:predicted transcriptional regulator of viral defense system
MSTINNTHSQRAGINVPNRKLLDLLNRQARGPFGIKEAAEILGLSRLKATRLLAYFAAGGWLNRLRKGLYITVPLGTLHPSQRKEDAWITAANVFEPCYIGGWSACEYWEFTEQIFNSVVVITSHSVRRKEIEIQGTNFVVKYVPKKKLFGTKQVWREQIRVPVSDPSRTISDLLCDPWMGGGIRHVASVLREYLESKHRNDQLLIQYLDDLNNGAAFKRLGYLVESLQLDAPVLIAECRRHMRKGFPALDPAVEIKGHYLRRWNLRINSNLSGNQEY